MTATQIPQAIPDSRFIKHLQRRGLDPKLAKAWAQTKAMLEQYLELVELNGGMK